jgi:hypothetical protein
MSGHIDDIKKSESRRIPSKLDQFVMSVKTPQDMVLKFSSDMAKRFAITEESLRSDQSKFSLTTQTDGNPAPQKTGPPHLLKFSQPRKFFRKKASWPLELSATELPFQAYSAPANSDTDALRRSLPKVSSQPKVKDVTFTASSFRALEETVSESVQGMSVLTSLVETLVPLLGKEKVEEGQEEFQLRDSDEIDKGDLANLISGVHSCMGNLSTLILNQRTQLAALYRVEFLSSSGFDEEERKQLRSLPLSNDALFNPGWLEFFLDKKRKTNQELLLNKVARDSERAPRSQNKRPRSQSRLQNRSRTPKSGTTDSARSQQQKKSDVPGQWGSFRGKANYRGRGGQSRGGGRGGKPPKASRQNPSFQ